MAEYTREELEKMVTSKKGCDRMTAAEHGVGLEKLVDDPDPFVRAVVATQQYGLEKLVNDPDPIVRYCVALQSYGVHLLKHDVNAFVRRIARDMLEQRKGGNHETGLYPHPDAGWIVGEDLPPQVGGED